MSFLFFRRGYAGDIWKLLKTILPEWKLPDVELEKSTEAGICVSKDGSTQVLSVRILIIYLLFVIFTRLSYINTRKIC